MNVLEHLHPTTLIPLKLGGLDISISNAVVSLWLAASCSIIFFLLAARSLRPVPTRIQNVAESGIVFLREEIVSQIHHDRGVWLPFLVSLFTFILFNNLLGLIPGLAGSTTNINVTASLAIMIFLVVQIYGFYRHGFLGYLKSFLPSGVPLPILIFMIPIELIGLLAKPFSLALRLFANMFAGHAVMLLVISLIFVFRSVLITPLPVIGNTAILLFEIFVAFIQAFVFTYLSAMYIATAQAGH